MLKRASEELDKAVDDLRNTLFAKTMEEPQTTFKTREVYDIIRQQYRDLKKEHEDLFVTKFQIQRQIISPQRAIFMAKNIFVHGEYKRLREKIRRYKKEEQKGGKRIPKARLVGLPALHFLANSVLPDQTADFTGNRKGTFRTNQILSAK